MEAVEALGANSGHTNNYVFILQCDELPPEHVVYIPCYRGLKCIRLLKSVRLAVPITRSSLASTNGREPFRAACTRRTRGSHVLVPRASTGRHRSGEERTVRRPPADADE